MLTSVHEQARDQQSSESKHHHEGAPMTPDDVVKEVGPEVLARHNFFARTTALPKEVGVYTSEGTWVVYMTDERGGDAGTLVYADEDAALAQFSALVRYFSRSGRDSAW